MRFFSLLLLFAVLIGCGKEKEEPPPPTHNQPKLTKIVAFGNSLTAGLGLEAWQTYPAQLQKLLDADGYKYEVVNAGISGDTTSGGLRRLDWSIDEDVKIVILELGGNDILRGQQIDLVIKNLGTIIEQLQKRNIAVLLAGIEAPANSGPEYRKEVHEAFRNVAEKYHIPLVPFILADVFGKPGMMQDDGTHPTANGAAVVAHTIYKSLKPLLKK